MPNVSKEAILAANDIKGRRNHLLIKTTSAI
jgi:hypothetical protein